MHICRKPDRCAAALDVTEEEGLLDRANAIGAGVKVAPEGMDRRNDAVPIASVRGPGAMVAFDVMKGRGTVEPDPDRV